MASALALILADHEGPWEWSRVRPALVVALLILGAVLVLLAAFGARRPGWLRSPSGLLALAGITVLGAALFVGIMPVQPSSYRVCGPILHEWTDRPPFCPDDLLGRRRWFTGLAWTAAGLLVVSVIVGLLTPRREAASGTRIRP